MKKLRVWALLQPKHVMVSIFHKRKKTRVSFVKTNIPPFISVNKIAFKKMQNSFSPFDHLVSLNF